MKMSNLAFKEELTKMMFHPCNTNKFEGWGFFE